MRIIVAHNRYKYAGGEDTVMRSEVQMLRSAGHTVRIFEADNRNIEGIVTKIAAATSLFRSDSFSSRMTALIRSFRPHLLHIHNWFPLLSPSIITAARAEQVPVVQTLHNFRMLCANANLFRDGKICHDCMGKAFPLGAAIHGCYLKSHVGSALVSAAYSYHRLAHTWDDVSLFIAVTEFQRGLLIRGGLEPTRIIVKPNFLRETGKVGEGRGGYALFVGRLTPEKGIRTVLDAWEQNRMSLPLKIMGDGPLAAEVRQRALRRRDIEYLGHQPSTEVYDAMSNARFLVFPSECYEAFGLTIVEAFSRGTPVLAADRESIAELVKDGLTGLRFKPGDSDDLAAKAALFSGDVTIYEAMRRHCRKTYEERYTEERNYKMLIDIYELAIQSSFRQRANNQHLNYLHPNSVLDREVS